MKTATQTWLDVLTTEDFRRITNVLDSVSAAIQPQYAHAPRIGAICKEAHDGVDATEDLQTVAKVSSLDSSYGTFLDWLGERIGTGREVEADGKEVELDDILYSALLRWKLAQNISATDSRSINDLLERLTGTKLPVQDVGAMTMVLEATSELSAEDLVLLRHFAPEIRPAGVGLIFTSDYSSMLGFNGQKLSTFNYGVFNTTPLE